MSAILLSGVLLWDWLAPIAVVTLWFMYRILRVRNAPPVLALAMSYQWAQVTLGVFYYGATGRVSPTIGYVDVRPMVLLGLASIAIMSIGVAAGMRWIRASERDVERVAFPFTGGPLFVAYVAAAALYGGMTVFAWRFPQITQLVLAMSYLRFAVFFVLLRTFVTPRPKWGAFALLLGLEVLLNVTGFFAQFREPLAIAAILLLERVPGMPSVVRARRLRALGGLVVASFVLAMTWTAIKPEYRVALISNRFESNAARLKYLAVRSVQWYEAGSDEWLSTTDQFVDRVWQVYYPALALERVPSAIPHTNGAILGDALNRLVTPRLFFPDKKEMINDSEKVRQFAGVWVSGAESGTTFAFGYVADSYVDFGLPLMFLPIVLYGVFVGIVFMWVLQNLRHYELALGVATLIAWLSLHVYEASWSFMLGRCVTLVVVLGTASMLSDRFLLKKERSKRQLRRRPSRLPSADVQSGSIRQ